MIELLFPINVDSQANLIRYIIVKMVRTVFHLNLSLDSVVFLTTLASFPSLSIKIFIFDERISSEYIFLLSLVVAVLNRYS